MTSVCGGSPEAGGVGVQEIPGDVVGIDAELAGMAEDAPDGDRFVVGHRARAGSSPKAYRNTSTFAQGDSFEAGDLAEPEPEQPVFRSIHLSGVQ